MRALAQCHFTAISPAHNGVLIFKAPCSGWFQGEPRGSIETNTTSAFAPILWVDKILHHFETMGNHCSLVFTGESSFPCFLGGTKWISSIHSSSWRFAFGRSPKESTGRAQWAPRSRCWAPARSCGWKFRWARLRAESAESAESVAFLFGFLKESQGTRGQLKKGEKKKTHSGCLG